MVQFECPKHIIPSVSSNFKVGWIPFSNNWPSGVIKIGLPVWKWKSRKSFGTKWAQRAANIPVWMPQALKHLYLIQFWNWENSLFSLLALWGNKNWPPSITMREIENFHNKMGLKGCKWPSLNSPRTHTPLSHSFLELEIFLFSLLALLGNKKWPPSIKMKQIENCQNKMGLMGCKWSSLNAPGTQSCHSHSILELGDSPFPIISPLG